MAESNQKEKMGFGMRTTLSMIKKKFSNVNDMSTSNLSDSLKIGNRSETPGDVDSGSSAHQPIVLVSIF